MLGILFFLMHAGYMVTFGTCWVYDFHQCILDIICYLVYAGYLDIFGAFWEYSVSTCLYFLVHAGYMLCRGVPNWFSVCSFSVL